MLCEKFPGLKDLITRHNEVVEKSEIQVKWLAGKDHIEFLGDA